MVCGLCTVMVCGLWSVVCGLWSVVCGLWSVVCGLCSARVAILQTCSGRPTDRALELAPLLVVLFQAAPPNHGFTKSLLEYAFLPNGTQVHRVLSIHVWSW